VTDDPASAALAEIRDREQSTVPGPWEARETSASWELILGNDRYHRALVRAPKTEAWPGTANGEFIAHARTDVARLLAALDAVLAPHAPRPDVLYGASCAAHRLKVPTLNPVPGCGECRQDQRRDVCPECRDEYGDPVLFGDCRARKAALAALTGKGEGGDR
jgi:hypothetical protein